jgi:hypothetical protein
MVFFYSALVARQRVESIAENYELFAATFFLSLGTEYTPLPMMLWVIFMFIRTESATVCLSREIGISSSFLIKETNSFLTFSDVTTFLAEIYGTFTFYMSYLVLKNSFINSRYFNNYSN